jgi:hypothetical protein
MMAIPRKLQLSGRTVDVIFDHEKCQNRSEYGYASFVHGFSITLDDTLPYEQQVNTFLHEAVHILSIIYDCDLDESQVKRIANGLYDLLRQVGPEALYKAVT